MGKNIVMLAAIVASLLICGGCRTSGPAGGGQALETYAKGVYAYQDGKQDEAVDALRAALESNPQLIMPRVMLGKIYKERGDYQNALQYFEALTQMDPYELNHRYNLGLSYQMLKRLQEAASAYRKALELNPNDFGSNMNLGLAYLALGDIDQSVKYTQRAADIRPDSAEAQANLAVALDSKGEYARAEIAYRKSLELAPKQPGTLINYANNLLAQGKWQAALEVITETLKTEDTPYMRKRYGDALAMGQRHDEALQQYREALKRNPKYYSALNEQARVLILQYQAGMELEDKKRDDALGLLRQSLEISPNQPKVKALLEDWERRMFSR